MNSQVNQYVIGGAVIILILLIIYNTSATLQTPQNKITIKKVVNTVQQKPTQTLSPNEQMMKRIKDEGLPDTDEYMSHALRAQLNELHNRFYYDNCRYAPLE